MANPKSLRVKITRFLIVGLGNTAVDFIMFALSLRLGAAALIANIVAWVVAVSFSYAVNSAWSFDRARSHRHALPRFLILGAVVSLLVSSLSLGVFAGTVGVWPAKIAGTVVAAVLNFIVARWSIEARLGRGEAR
jgi:putative flippase GtrA